jgi:hypothetical protein
MLPASDAPPTPPPSPPSPGDLENVPCEPVDIVPSDAELVDVPSPVNLIPHETQSTQDLGYSLFGRRRRPSRRLLESLGKAYATGTLNATATKVVDPLTFHKDVSGPNQLE